VIWPNEVAVKRQGVGIWPEDTASDVGLVGAARRGNPVGGGGVGTTIWAKEAVSGWSGGRTTKKTLLCVPCW
jgi:hypothetical protein